MLHLHRGHLELQELQLVGQQHLEQTSSMQLFELTHGQRRKRGVMMMMMGL